MDMLEFIQSEHIEAERRGKTADDWADKGPTSRHALHRTSPKGEDFIGTCRNCGTENLTIQDFATQECPNQRGATEADNVLDALSD